jgi:hypothetical protein
MDDLEFRTILENRRNWLALGKMDEDDAFNAIWVNPNALTQEQKEEAHRALVKFHRPMPKAE